MYVPKLKFVGFITEKRKIWETFSQIYPESIAECSALVIMNMNVCLICGDPSERRCSACGNATYCSPEHQKKDWKVHRVQCVVYKVSENSKFGRYLTATRTIPEGTIILIEKPIVLGPKLYSLPICLGCYRKVDGSYFCTQCGFPMCSKECQQVAAHSQNECKIFAIKSSSPKKIADYSIPHPLYQSILPLRCLLLRESSPEKWAALSTLEHHVESRKRLSEVWDEFQVNIVQFLRDWHGLGQRFCEETVNRVIGFVEVNSFQIKTGKLESCGLFRLGGLMSHDCRPNTHHAFSPEGNFILRASVPIQKGSPITMSYVDNLSGTIERRQILAQSKYFDCDCARCQDPTEFGTYISAVKCSACQNGYLLPQNPLSPDSLWECLSCHTTLTLPEINSKLDEIKPGLQALLTSSSRPEIEAQLSLVHSQILHTNHFLLLPLWKHLLNLRTDAENSFESKSSTQIIIGDLKQTRLLAERLLNVLNLVDPGLTRGRGVLLRHLHGIEAQLLKTEPETVHEEKLHGLEIEIRKIFELDNLI